MATVGFKELYRYGGKFFGYLLVVEGLAAAFLVGGGYLASRVMTLTDPSMAALSQTQAFVGIFMMAVGVVLATIGFFGLAHKLLTESLQRALAVHEAELAVSPDPSPASADEEAAEPSDEEPTGEDAAESKTPSEPETDQAPLINRDAPDTTEPSGVGPDSSGGGEPVDAPSPPVEPPVDEEPTPAPATGGPEPAEAPVDDAPEPEPTAGEPTETSAEDSPPEWTPPDPSEFDTTPEVESDAAGDQSTGGSSPEAGSEPEPGVEEEAGGGQVDPDELADDQTLADEGVESFRPGGEDDPLADRLPGDEE